MTVFPCFVFSSNKITRLHCRVLNAHGTSSKLTLTHFSLIFHFYTTWKRQESLVFYRFQEVQKWNIWLKWVKDTPERRHSAVFLLWLVYIQKKKHRVYYSGFFIYSFGHTFARWALDHHLCRFKPCLNL